MTGSSQWLAYGERGGGFSVGVDAIALFDAVRAAHPHARPLLGPVIYNHGEQSRVIEKLYRTTKESLLRLLDAEGLSNAGPEKAASLNASHAEAFTQAVFLHAPFFKQSTFEEEKEWRLVLTDTLGDARVQFRPHSIAPVPYVNVPLSESTVVSIRIGPRRDHALARRSLELLIRDRSIDILSSEVTLR